jgi:glycosyltransferase involved in cell wall biosynthesis
VQPITWGFRKNSLRNVTHLYPHIKEILKNVKPDIIELWEEPFSLVATHTIFWAKRVKPLGKIIFFSAQNIHKRYPLPFSFFEKYTHKNGHFAFLMNDEVARIVRRKGYTKELLVLPLGVDAETFCKKDVSALGEKLALRDFVVGFIGKISEEKGILDLIEAISKINRKIQLLIIGNGDLTGEIEGLVRLLGLQQKTIIIDAIPNSEVPDYLNCMDLLVVPSTTTPHWKEQFGRVVVEGMACEVPVIGSDSGEIPTTIGKAGLVFKERDVADLRDKIEALIRNRNLRAMLAEKGRKRVLENFSWKVIAEKQYQVYRELMGEGKWAT